MGGYSKGNLIGCGDIVITVVVVAACFVLYWYYAGSTAGAVCSKYLTSTCGR
jgi:hypothetical protein